jgi:thioredoxin reductase (NADPH)
MAENPEAIDARFPELDKAQIARLMPLGEQRHYSAGEIVFDQGDSQHGVFVVLDGSIELVSVLNGQEAPLAVHGAGKFTGEVNLLSGRRALVRCRAYSDCKLLEISRANLQKVMQSDAGISELFLRAFILRRVYMITHSIGDAVLIGSANSADTLRLRAFLSRNGIRLPTWTWNAMTAFKLCWTTSTFG